MRGRYTESGTTEQRLEIQKSGLCNTLTGVQKDNLIMEKVKIKQATNKGYIECKIGGVADLSFPESKTRRGRVQEGGDVSPTLTAGESEICKIESPYRIRKLTPLECWRLMGFTDEEFHKAESVNSNTQLYKQAGNSIVVDVLVGIFGQIIKAIDGENQEKELDAIEVLFMQLRLLIGRLPTLEEYKAAVELIDQIQTLAKRR